MDRLPYELCKPTYEAVGFEFNGPEQAAPVIAADRFPCIFGGERSGKSWDASKILLPHVIALPYLRRDDFFFPNAKLRFDPRLSKPRNPHFALYGPTYVEPRIEFEYLEADLKRLGKLVEQKTSKPTDGDWQMVTTEGVVIKTLSTQVVDSIRAINLEGAIVCEAGGHQKAAIDRIRGRVAATKGFIIYVGTLEKSQQWWKDWQLIGNRENDLGIKSYIIPSWANRIEFPGGREDPEIKQWWASLALTDPDLPLERLAAISRPLRERVVSEAKEAHIRDVEIPEDAKHEIWVDPGYASAYAVLFVAIWEKDGRKFFHCYDELYEQRLNTEQMIDLCRRKPTWYKISPGDGVIDIASQGHRDSTTSALEIWEQRTDVNFNRKFWHEDRQRERLQNCFRTNQISVSPKCKGFIAELGLGEPVFPEMHPWKYATDRDGRIRSEKPIDRWNHSVKAAAYGLLHHLGQVESKRKPMSMNRITAAQRQKQRGDAYRGSPWD